MLGRVFAQSFNGAGAANSRAGRFSSSLSFRADTINRGSRFSGRIDRNHLSARIAVVTAPANSDQRIGLGIGFKGMPAFQSLNAIREQILRNVGVGHERNRSAVDHPTQNRFGWHGAPWKGDAPHRLPDLTPGTGSIRPRRAETQGKNESQDGRDGQRKLAANADGVRRATPI